MSQQNINGNVYAGKPLTAYIFDGESWGGRSNFIASNQKVATIDLNDLDDCFYWMRRWVDDDYQYGYVLDYETKTVYYDDQRSLDHLNQRIFPKRNLEGYFELFIERSFC